MSETPHPVTWTIGGYLKHLDAEHADEGEGKELDTIITDLAERERKLR